MKTILLPPKAQIFRQGDPLAFFYTVEEGVIKVTRVNAKGRISYGYLVYRNSPLGEEGRFGFSQHTGTAETLTPAKLYRVDIAVARNAIEYSRPLADFLAEYDSMRRQQLTVLIGASAQAKVGWAFLEAEHASNMGLKVTQTLIGELSGTSRERIGSIMKELAKSQA